ncbi:ABC transporter permease, partial [Streptomyces azureus]
MGPMKQTARPPGHRPVRTPIGTAAVSAPPPARAATRRRPASQQWAAWAFLAPVTLYLVLFYAYPL